ncbi:hypothetical protein ES703_45317 [subsurface metagenome]
MIEAPKSLTAVVHVRFHYEEPEAKPVGEGDVEIISRILDRGSELSPDMQEILAKFANYLSELGEKQAES